VQTDGVTLYADQAAAGGARVSTEPEVDCTLRSSALCTVCTQRRRAPAGIEGQLGPHGQGVATLMVDDAQRAHVGRGVLLASTRNWG
jgi:hypothetical protein